MRLPLSIVLAAAGIYVLGDAVLTPTPVPEHPGFVDAVLASRAVMAAIRLAIVFAGAFLVLSVIALVAQRRWLVRVGPVQVSETNADGRPMKEDAGEALRALDILRQQLSHFTEALDERSGKRKDSNGGETGSRNEEDASGGHGYGR